MSDDEEARKARAEQYHKQIEEIKSTPLGGTVVDDNDGDEAEAEPPPSEDNPRDFIQRRMSELDKPKKKTKKKK